MAYGEDVFRKLEWVLQRLSDPQERHYAFTTLGMDAALLDSAVHALSGELRTPGRA